MRSQKTQLRVQMKNMCARTSIYPLGEVVARFERCCYLSGIHGGILGKVFGVLPFKELFPILCVRFASEVTIRSRFLIFWLTQGQGHCDRPWTAIELDLHNVGYVIGRELATLRTIRLHEERQRL